MNYSIKILSSEEFDELPYSKVGIALGVADPKTNTAYIRHSAHSELNKYLIDHEFEHLVEEIPTDEFEGVRYKIPILGPIASGLGKFGSAIGRGASNVVSKVGGMFGGSGLPQGAGIQGSQVPGMATQFTNPMNAASNLINTTGRGSFPASRFAQSPAQQPSILGSFLSGGNGQKAAGVASLGLGLLKGFPKVPNLPPSVDELRKKVSSGGSALGQFGQGKLQELMGQSFNPLSEPEIQASLRQLELDQGKAEDQVRDLYRNLRPGTDPSSDTTFRRDLQEVQDQFARAKSDTVATRTRDVKSMFDQQRLQQIQLSLGASESEMSQLAKIAELDIGQIMAQLQLDAQQAQIFKDTFLDLGASLINPQPVFNLFGGENA